MNKYLIGLVVVLVLLVGYGIGYLAFDEKPTVTVCPNYNVTCEVCGPTYNQSEADYHNKPAEDYKEEHAKKFNKTELDGLSGRDKIMKVLERFN